MLVSLPESEEEKDIIALLLSEYFFLSNSQIPTSLVVWAGCLSLFKKKKSLKDLFKDRSDRNEEQKSSAFFSFPDPQKYMSDLQERSANK